MSKIPTTGAIDRCVQGSYFVFQFIHVFLFVTIPTSVSSVIALIIQNPTLRPIAANIPTASNFFFSFLSLKGLSIAVRLLLQIATLILLYLLEKLFDNISRRKWKQYLHRIVLVGV